MAVSVPRGPTPVNKHNACISTHACSAAVCEVCSLPQSVLIVMACLRCASIQCARNCNERISRKRYY